MLQWRECNPYPLLRTTCSALFLSGKSLALEAFKLNIAKAKVNFHTLVNLILALYYLLIPHFHLLCLGLNIFYIFT